jgi:peptidyl-prolyl cis-trans isomerase A (cyclophilin A)
MSTRSQRRSARAFALTTFAALVFAQLYLPCFVSTPPKDELNRRNLLAASLGALIATPSAVRAEEDDSNVAVFNVKLNGDSSETKQVKVRLHPEWAPRGVRRFKELVKIGELDNAAVFHVDKATAQFGLPAEPTLTPAKIKDDHVRTSNRRGTLTFAQSGHNSRVNQLFFNTKDNGLLDSKGFAPIGEVLDGMDVVDQLYDGYGKRPKRDEILAEGNKYLDEHFPKLSKIKSVEVSF